MPDPITHAALGPLGSAIRPGRVALPGAAQDLTGGLPVDAVADPTGPTYHHNHPELTRSSP